MFQGKQVSSISLCMALQCMRAAAYANTVNNAKKAEILKAFELPCIDQSVV